MNKLPTVIVALLFSFQASLVWSFSWSSVSSDSELPQLWRGFQAQTHTAVAAGFPYAECFERASVQRDVPLPLLLAVARGESDFKAQAVSSAGALGIMQILWPGTARDLGFRNRAETFAPCANIDAGARYLAQMHKRYEGNWHAALIAYNRGPANVDALIRKGILGSADWYSGYVWDHLGFVLARLAEGESTDYQNSQRLVFITFNMPFRAQDLVAHLRAQAPSIRFDWFKRQTGRFAVSVHYENAQQRSEGERYLKRLGLLRS